MTTFTEKYQVWYEDRNVSSRLKEEYDNAKVYYAHHGEATLLPRNPMAED